MNGCILIWHRELLLTINWMGEKLNLLIRYYRSSTVVVSTARHHCNDPWVRVGLGDHRTGLSQTCQSKINRNINKYSIWHLCFFTINNASPVSCRKTTRARWIRLYLEHLSKKEVLDRFKVLKFTNWFWGTLDSWDFLILTFFHILVASSAQLSNFLFLLYFPFSR